MTAPFTLGGGIYETEAETRLGGLPDYDHVIDTASIWTVHLHLPMFDDVVEAITEALDVLVDENNIEPEIDGVIGYVGGDSWRQWCEATEGEHDWALHVYFHETNPWAAWAQGKRIAALLGIEGPVTSTAGDWAEQLGTARWPATLLEVASHGVG